MRDKTAESWELARGTLGVGAVFVGYGAVQSASCYGLALLAGQSFELDDLNPLTVIFWCGMLICASGILQSIIGFIYVLALFCRRLVFPR